MDTLFNMFESDENLNYVTWRRIFEFLIIVKTSSALS